MIDERRLYEALGLKLKALREPEGQRGKLTQAELARQIGLERTSVTNIERGNQKVPLHVLYRICEALGVNIYDLLPDVGQAQALPSAPRMSEVEFAGKTVTTTPLVAQKISEIIQTGETNEPDT